MVVLVILTIASFLLPITLRAIACSIALFISVIIVFRADRIARKIFTWSRNRSERSGPDLRALRKERYLAAKGLRLAVMQTELASLFPDAFAIARRLGAGSGGTSSAA